MAEAAAETPRVNRSQNGSSIIPVTVSPGDFSAFHTRPTVADLHGENRYAQAARKYWLDAKKPPKVRRNALKEELWDPLEKEDFAFGSLLILENLQLVEQYLWPGYTEDSSDHHVLLLALLVNTKRRENLLTWDLFSGNPKEFSSFFRRILSMSIDISLPLKVRQHLILFIIGGFQSLDSGLVRKECASLVSISLWHNLHDEASREGQLEKNPMLRKAWRAAARKFDAADEDTKARLRFERSWLYTLLLDFIHRINQVGLSGQTKADNLLYCERFIELLTDLLSQLPTRRYVNTLLKDLHLLPAILQSTLYGEQDAALFRDLISLFRHFAFFPIEDHSGQQQSDMEYHRAHCNNLARLQRIAFRHFPEKLNILALSNYGSLSQRADLESHLGLLDDEELVRLCQLLGLRSQYPKSISVRLDRAFYLAVLTSAFQSRPSYREAIRDLAILPTEKSLYESAFYRNATYNGSRPLAIPKLNLQYLTMGDFLWRSFVLHRCESLWEIRTDIEDVIKRLQPKSTTAGTRFNGFSRMALQISKPAIVDVAPANVGETHPAQVTAEVILDVSRLKNDVRREWDSLKPDDVVFLISVEPLESRDPATNGHTDSGHADKIGLKRLRAAEVIYIQDENGRPLRDEQQHINDDGQPRRTRQRRLLLKLDAVAYQADLDRQAVRKSDIYDSVNVLVRRRGRENNFKPILESIRKLTLSDIPAPAWLQEVFLGYGDPASATYMRLTNRLKKIDFRDTFLDWQHLIESLPGKIIEPNDDAEGSFGPPYVLEYPSDERQAIPIRPSKKRRLDHEATTKVAEEVLHVSSYKPLNTGPYPTDIPRLNSVRFTPKQIEAITSGTQPGLTIIIGPPGTGKTDVATQIINNIYHNFPNQRTLLVAHSNQALNQLFQKIVALDIDERHLLRLGHGEEELETEASYSKHGRVESFLALRTRYLAEVDRLAISVGAPGAHGGSCETADYFNMVYVKPAWTEYWDKVQSAEYDLEQITNDFPFHQYFADAPQPLFSPDMARDALIEVAAGCYRHVEKIFQELEDIRPFEILRHPRDKANYLLIKEARIIAMTSTHAAMRRQEIAGLGFHYDNIVMEEAAQITEIENFIPLALQEPEDGGLPLQRIVLCGDHLQNSPIVQNLAFRQYANLDQSLFLRLVRLGVPSIMLDQQGRARPSLAELYKWRYPQLSSLPRVQHSREFLTANPGFRYEYQFINVSDYKGRGEMEPTPHFIQNLGEAEYAVALYMYMRLLDYPASQISILTTYAGQRALIKDVLNHRCKGNPLFELPRIVTTVDKYQGEQNDYVILSLTRTSRVGYLRDIRRLTVALSRARLGLYVLGRREVFEACYELQPAFSLLFTRPDKLSLVTNEMYGGPNEPVARLLTDDVKATEMAGVEHIGQYVFQMTKAKVAALKAGGGVILQIEEPRSRMDLDKEDGDVVLEQGEEPEEE